MEKSNLKRKVNIKPKNKQWELYQQFNKLTAKQDTLPEAGQPVQHRSAPQDLTLMVF